MEKKETEKSGRKLFTMQASAATTSPLYVASNLSSNFILKNLYYKLLERIIESYHSNLLQHILYFISRFKVIKINQCNQQ